MFFSLSVSEDVLDVIRAIEEFVEELDFEAFCKH
jgi:uncharacterized protein with HEPN domain